MKKLSFGLLSVLFVIILSAATARADVISTFAGDGISATLPDIPPNGEGGPATAARLHSPTGIATDLAGNVYFADQGTMRVRKVDALTGIITTVAGTGVSGGTGFEEGLATSVPLSFPHGIAVDLTGNIFIADRNHGRIVKVDPAGNLTRVVGPAGCGDSGDGGPAIDAALCNPEAVAVDTAGNLYVSNTAFATIRKVDAVTPRPSR